MEAPATAILQAIGLACRRGERQLFRDIGFALGPGRVLYLRGANGSGKTSLLRLLAGLLLPEEGTLLWRGRDVAQQASAYRAELAFLGHLDALKPQLTLRDNLAFWRDLQGGDGDIALLLQQVGLAGCAELPARHLSAGQRRRFGLARLLLRPVKLWLLDEPITALDADARNMVIALIETHLADGGMAVISSHDDLPVPGDVLALGGRRAA